VISVRFLGGSVAAAVGLVLLGCATGSGPARQLSDLDSCVDRQDGAYVSLRDQVETVMAEQGLDLPESLTGLEAAAKLRVNRAASVSNEDMTFLKEHGFFALYPIIVFTPERFAALRRCLEQRHGMKIRVIEVRAP
jgi:hypothetical protein